MLIVAQRKHAMGKSMTGVVVPLQTNVKKEEGTVTSEFLFFFFFETTKKIIIYDYTEM